VLEEILQTPGQARSEQMLEWLDLPGASLALACKDYHAANLDFYYDSVIVCGTGGSYLGCKMLQEVLPLFDYMQGKDPAEATNQKQMHYVGQHVSAFEFAKTRDAIKTTQPLLLFISKSGSTLETSIGASLLIGDLKEKYPGNYQQRIVAISSSDLGQKPGFDELLTQPVLDLPSGVGGRYSVLSNVGVAPLTFAGFDVQQVLAGAQKCLEDAESSSETSALCRFAANRAGLGKGDRALEAWMYAEPALEFLGLWWQQLFAESEGKDGKGALPVPIQISRDLHSVGQWLQDGPKQYWQTFVGVEADGEFSAFSKMHTVHKPDDAFDLKLVKSSLGSAVKGAHQKAGNRQIHLSLKEWSPECLGYFIQWSMLACALTCKLQGINPFDQPGVEAYKQLFNKALR
jgi:glucose-6-phosphate isomerase